MVAEIPQDRLLLETDAPWCGIKKTHPSHPHVQTVFAPAALKKKEKHISGYLVRICLCLSLSLSSIFRWLFLCTVDILFHVG